jgi:hypothetical protein
MPTKSALPSNVRFRIVGLSEASPRSVNKYFLGLPMRPSVEAAVRRAVAKLGIPDPRAAKAVQS